MLVPLVYNASPTISDLALLGKSWAARNANLPRLPHSER